MGGPERGPHPLPQRGRGSRRLVFDTLTGRPPPDYALADLDRQHRAAAKLGCERRRRRLDRGAPLRRTLSCTVSPNDETEMPAADVVAERGRSAPRLDALSVDDRFHQLGARSRSPSDPTGPFLFIVLNELCADTVHVREYASRRMSKHPPANLGRYLELRGRLLEALLNQPMPQAVSA